jgi:hypothetical protein
MARGAISRAFVYRLLGGDLDDRFSPVVAIFIKRIGSEKSLGAVCQHGESHNEQQESGDMLRHGLTALFIC